MIRANWSPSSDQWLKGLGACIIQDGQPIAFMSKSLMDTETCYTNIVRELLAIIYGCEKFHTYLYGRTFIMGTDHKPLKMISLKNLTAAPVCLQRMLLHLQQDDLVIMYWPGREMLLVDALSHLPSRMNTEIKLDLWVDAISMFAFTLRCLTKIGTETQWDPILSMVHRLTLNGWPDRQGCVPGAARFYWSFHDELSMETSLPRVNEWSFHHPAETVSWLTSMKAMQESTRQWTWPRCVFTGPACKQMWLTTLSGAWHTLNAATCPWRHCNPMMSLLDLGQR